MNIICRIPNEEGMSEFVHGVKLFHSLLLCNFFKANGRRVSVWAFEYLVYYIGYSVRGTTLSVPTYPLTMRSIRGGTLGWNIEIHSTPTNQFDWSVSRAYVINIYHAKSRLNTPVWGSLHSPNYIPPPLTVHFQ